MATMEGLLLTDAERELLQRTNESLKAVVAQHDSVNAVERQSAAAHDTWSALIDLGFPGFLIPELYGGNDNGLMAAAIVMEELAALGLHSFGPILTTMGAAAIAQFGSDVLKGELLGRIAGGDITVAVASTEPDAGFNVLNTKTFAERRGDHFVLNGSKIYISGLDVVDSVLLVARTLSREECRRKGLRKGAGISVFLIENDADGLERTQIPTRGEGVLKQFSLNVHDVQVSADRLLGNEQSGADVLFKMFNPERVLVSAMAVGMTRYCLDLACDYASTRRVFGDTPIGAYQSIQHPLADVAIRLEATRLLLCQSARLFDAAADPAGVGGAANSAKYLSSELALKAVDAAFDTFGGKGFDEDYGLVHLWEAARLLSTVPVSNALILNGVAERTLGLPRSY